LTAHVGNVNNDQEEFVKSALKTLKQSSLNVSNKTISFNKKISPLNFYEWEHLRYSENNLVSFTLTSNPKKIFDNIFEKNDIYDD